MAPQIEPWEKEVYDRIVQADTDHSGAISVRNLFDFIRQVCGRPNAPPLIHPIAYDPH